MASTDPSDLTSAVARWNRADKRVKVAAAEVDRERVVGLFPLTSWPTMSLKAYALGAGSPDTYCYTMEFGSSELGGIGGGNAKKHIIYRRATDGTYFYNTERYADEQQAWLALRSAFVRAFELGGQDLFADIDDIPELKGGMSLVTKSLFLYFPDRFLPIYSEAHLDHFTRLLGGPGGTLDRVQANRRLFELVYSMPEFEGWSPVEIMWFLYFWKDPTASHRIVKIAPGEGAKYWDACLAGGYICVGWDEIGDLSGFDSFDEMRSRFADLYASEYGGAQGAVTLKAKEVWTLHDLEPGDIVVANKGISEVLAIGTVTTPGYVWREDRVEYRHTVNVTWDVSAARQIAPVKRWAVKTVAPVSQELYGLITSTSNPDAAARPEIPPSALMQEIALSLERRDQVILYGAPGTGKTYTARRFAVWWLRTKAGNADAKWLLGSQVDLDRVETELSKTPAGGAGKFAARLTRITFHPSYAYEDFVEGYKPREVTGSTGLNLALTDGIFFRVCETARINPDKQYLILIDEINRGNIPKIFGELITVIEKDKRGYGVILPQSGRELTVPANVYILGTMNTADRSIRLLDAALRRRFAFVELPPDPTMLGVTVGPLALDAFLVELNRRITKRLGGEKVVGQSFFLEGGEPVSTEPEFAQAFIHDLMPLFQEYAYDNPAVLADLLGSGMLEPESSRIKDELISDPEKLVAMLHQSFKGTGGGDDS